jgi:hypothetical protein
MSYKLLLVTPDGDDYQIEGGNKNHTKDDVWDLSGDMGSRWFFYPLHFVITDLVYNGISKAQKVIDAPFGLEFLKGRTLAYLKEYLKDNVNFIEALING